MSGQIEVTKLHLIDGVWRCALAHRGADDWRPEIEVTHLDHIIEGVTVAQDRDHDHWVVSVPIPADRISDGVQSFVIRERGSETVLTSFAIVAGDALAEDLRAEMSLLRAELDMLKKAFRRHCVETAQN